MAKAGRTGRLTAAARKAQLIEIGLAAFARRGYEATSVEEIAERAGVSKPIVYEHFGGKEGLYAAIVDREVEQIVARIVAAITAGTPRERLEQAVARLPRLREGAARTRSRSCCATRRRRSAAARCRRSCTSWPIASATSSRTSSARRASTQGGADLRARAGRHGRLRRQWWTESKKPPATEAVASHIAALAWMGLRHLPRLPAPLAAPERTAMKSSAKSSSTDTA